MPVYHTVQTNFGPFVFAFPCLFRNIFNVHDPKIFFLKSSLWPTGPFFTSTFSRCLPQPELPVTTLAHISLFIFSETSIKSVRDALTFNLLGNLWLLYLELFVINNHDNLTTQPVTDTSRISTLPPTSLVTNTCFPSTVISSTCNVSAGSVSWNWKSAKTSLDPI